MNKCSGEILAREHATMHLMRIELGRVDESDLRAIHDAKWSMGFTASEMLTIVKSAKKFLSDNNCRFSKSELIGDRFRAKLIFKNYAIAKGYLDCEKDKTVQDMRARIQAAHNRTSD